MRLVRLALFIVPLAACQTILGIPDDPEVGGGGDGGGGGADATFDSPPGLEGTCAQPIPVDAIPDAYNGPLEGDSVLQASCGGSGKEMVFVYNPPQDGNLRVLVTSSQPVVTFFLSSCVAGAELACGSTDVMSPVVADEPVLIVVDSSATSTNIHLEVQFTTGGSAEGRVIFQEVRVEGHPEAGIGGLFAVEFNNLPFDRTPDYDDRDVLGQGCVAWGNVSTGTTAGAFPMRVRNEGAVSIMATRAIPTCIGSMGGGGPSDTIYACPAKGGVGTVVDGVSVGGSIPAGFAAFHVNPDPFDNNDVGWHLLLSGVSNAGVFPITSYDAGTARLLFKSPSAVNEAWGGKSWNVVAGFGPVVTAAANEVFQDDEQVRVVLDPTGPGSLAEFEGFDTGPMDVGDSFTLDAASASALTNIRPGLPGVTLACATCGDGQGTMVIVRTTDRSVAAGTFDFPFPVNSYSLGFCARFGVTSMQLPAAFLSAIFNAPFTRVQTVYSRLNLNTPSNSDGTHKTAVLVGHGTMGFTDP